MDKNTQGEPNSLIQKEEQTNSDHNSHQAELSDEESQPNLEQGPKLETNDRSTDIERCSDSATSILNEDVAVPAWKIRQISKHPSYHGAIDKKRAEYKLSKKNSNSYLIRYSEDRDQHTLSVRRKKEEEWVFRNFDIVVTNNDAHIMYEIRGTEEKFNDVAELLDFYKENSLDHHIDAIGEEVANDVGDEAAILASGTMLKSDSQEKAEDAEPRERKLPSEPSIRLKPRQYPCLIERGTDGTVTFVSTETGRKFSQSFELLEYTDTKYPKNYDGKIKEANELPSFHGSMSGYEAETRLREQESDCCYLTRYSESREELTLSVMRRKEDDYIFQNFDIIGEPEDCPTSYELFGSEEKFDSIEKLILFYRENPLNHNIDRIGDEVNGKKISTTQEGDSVVVVEAEKGSSTEAGPSHTQNLQKLISKEGLQNAVPQWALQAIKNHSSFHGSITRIEAVKRLIESGRSCYLTRYSGYNKCCIITVLRMSATGELLQHVELEIPHNRSQHIYKVAGANKSFEDISQLLEYYQKNPLNNEGYFLGDCLQSEKSMDLATEDQDEITGTEEKEKEAASLSRPTKSNLHCIPYQDVEGETHDFKLLEQVSDRWFKAGMLLRLNKLEKYRDKSGDDVKSCELVFFKWIKKNGHEDYPLTWVGLHTLLIDMGRRTAAEKLYKVLKNRETKVDTMYRDVS